MAKWSDFETHPVGTADRIKELEAKLAECEARLEKAVEGLSRAKENLHEIWAGDMTTFEAQDEINTTLAELTSSVAATKEAGKDG